MKRNAVHCGQSVFLCSRPPRRRPRWQPLDRLVSSPISPGSVCFPAAAIQLSMRFIISRRAKARWVRVFPPAGNEKSSDKDRCFCAHRPDPRGAHAPLRSFARVGLLTDAFRGIPNALVRPSLPAITAVPMTRFRNARLRARTSAPQSQLRNQKPAGSGPMSGTCTRFPCSAEQDLRVRVSPGRAVATKAAY